jgi:pyruvate, orthophosphate dikinase
MTNGASKMVYFFGGNAADGNGGQKDLLGGKGANLAEMVLLGIPVPPGFTISTETCRAYFTSGGFPDGLASQVEDGLSRIEKVVGRSFGDPANPLLVSVRSGAPISMPGMMDTVLNLGLNDVTVEALASASGNPRFAWDSYRRLVAMYGDVVMGLKPESKNEQDPFAAVFDEQKRKRGVDLDTELDANDLAEIVEHFKATILQRTGRPFPQDPREQLWGAIGAVFSSWNNDRAIKYREMNNIPAEMGTAVNVQAMVFGNMGADCATGVAFTRDPATGDGRFFGEYLINAQGEDVVAGIRTPQQVTIEGSRSWAENAGVSEHERATRFPSLEEYMPEVHAELVSVYKKLEKHYRDMQDIEFTIQGRKLWMLQTRSGKRTAFAAFRIAVEMVEEGLISKTDALVRVEPDSLNQLLRPIFDATEKAEAQKAGRLLARGLNAGPGAATGRVVFNAEDAEAWRAAADKGRMVDGILWDKVILVRVETSPEDIRGMDVAEGILTARGGMTSHAALVARQMGKVCVAGCGSLDIDYGRREIRVADHVIRQGEFISIDGTTGEVLEGLIKTRPSEVLQVLLEKNLKPAESLVYRQFAELLTWADEIRTLKVRTNADQPDQAANARAFGAEGIGLCRTEHMFFGGDRIDAVREMILADDPADRQKALAKLLPMQRGDFEGIFEAMDGLPVTIRTLDPPLHEFLPHEDADIRDLAAGMNEPFEKVKAKVESLHEANPMLGHRGCRLGITFPEITEMQARAIFEATVACKARGVKVLPEVMIPLVGTVNELRLQRAIVDRVAHEVIESSGVQFEYMVGTMIELPRAALTADRIAEQADFFSFGTNDLTQTTFGISRDDMNTFVPAYREQKIFDADPFQAIDREGVGQLMEIAVSKGRRVRPKLKIGICGEHGGEPSSVKFCHKLGLDYVSCSPFRVAIARLAAAHAALGHKM